MNGLIGKGYVVKNDLYDIAKRLKEIDDGYFIFFNYRKKRYEIHSTKQVGSSLALVVPYNVLDGRTLTLVRQTSIERMDRIMEENRRKNARIERDRVKKISENASLQAEKLLSAT